MKTALAYANYLLRAKTRHGIHSPFVFNFLDRYLKSGATCPQAEAIEQIRKKLLHDERQIDFEDFGAGSKRVKDRKPRISQLAKNSLKPPKYARLICQLAQYIQAKNIIELGTSLGTTTLYLAKGNPAAKIYSIEGSPAVVEIAQEQFDALQCNNIDLRTGVFDDVLPRLLSETDKIDFVFIDGNHTKAATLRYFEMVLPKLSDNALVVFDDINWSDEMREAWSEIKARQQVRISMDFFFLGVVAVNPGLSKEDFWVRY